MLIHIDGDAFFASVYQSMHAHAKGKPVAIGKERSIVTALSYEAKRAGVTRGMLGAEALKVCPGLLLVSSDYRAYQVYSNRMGAIAEEYSPYVERYSIDEVFLDVTGMEKMHGMTYEELAWTIKTRIERSLGLTVSVGVGPTKTLVKIASDAEKPSGLVVINEHNRIARLQQTPIQDVWGIGWRLAPKMKSFGIQTAYDLTQKSEGFLRSHFNKMIMQTWYELQGHPIYSLACGHKSGYKSIQKTGTVTPATTDKALLLSRLFHHIEKAFIKARKYGYRVSKIDIFLKTQKFTYQSAHVRLARPATYPYLIRAEVRQAFDHIYRPNTPYRASGCTLYDFVPSDPLQQDLFREHEKIEERLGKLYKLYEDRKFRFGTDLLETHRHERRSLLKMVTLS